MGGRRIGQSAALASSHSDVVNERFGQSTGQSYWTVETGNVYGIDFVGFTPQTLVDIVQLHPASVKLPCTYSVKQEMEIECNDSTKWEYKLNQLTSSANVGYWY